MAIRNAAGLAICYGGALSERSRQDRWFASHRTPVRHAANMRHELAGPPGLSHDIKVLSI